MDIKHTIQPKVVPIEIAALMKAKGFDWKINEFYMYTPKAKSIKSSGGYKNHYNSSISYSNSDWAKICKDVKESFWKGIDEKHPNISAPTYDMAIDWLLEEKGFFVNAIIIYYPEGKRNWGYSYQNMNTDEVMVGRISEKVVDRYTALNECILEVLKKL